MKGWAGSWMEITKLVLLRSSQLRGQQDTAWCCWVIVLNCISTSCLLCSSANPQSEDLPSAAMFIYCSNIQHWKWYNYKFIIITIFRLLPVGTLDLPNLGGMGPEMLLARQTVTTLGEDNKSKPEGWMMIKYLELKETWPGPKMEKIAVRIRFHWRETKISPRGTNIQGLPENLHQQAEQHQQTYPAHTIDM